MARGFTEQERRTFAHAAARTNAASVASEAQVTVATVQRWMRKYPLSHEDQSATVPANTVSAGQDSSGKARAADNYGLKQAQIVADLKSQIEAHQEISGWLETAVSADNESDMIKWYLSDQKQKIASSMKATEWELYLANQGLQSNGMLSDISASEAQVGDIIESADGELALVVEVIPAPKQCLNNPARPTSEDCYCGGCLGSAATINGVFWEQSVPVLVTQDIIEA